MGSRVTQISPPSSLAWLRSTTGPYRPPPPGPPGLHHLQPPASAWSAPLTVPFPPGTTPVRLSSSGPSRMLGKCWWKTRMKKLNDWRGRGTHPDPPRPKHRVSGIGCVWRPCPSLLGFCGCCWRDDGQRHVAPRSLCPAPHSPCLGPSAHPGDLSFTALGTAAHSRPGAQTGSGSDEAAEASPGQREPRVQSVPGETSFCCTWGSPVDSANHRCPAVAAVGVEPLHQQSLKRLG